MSNKKPKKTDNHGAQTGITHSGTKPLHAADLKPISGGFVPNEQPVKIPEVMTIKIKLLDSDLSGEKND